MKIFKLFAHTALIFSISTSVLSAPITSCYDMNTGAAVNLSSFSSDMDGCQGEPAYYGITVYEMGLCATVPTAPTLASATDVSACEVVLTSSAGALAVVENGVTADINATTYRPASGTYNYAYMRLSNVFQIKGSADLGSGFTDRYCVSGTGTTDNETGLRGSCDTSEGTPGLTQTELVNFNGAGGGDAFTYTLGTLTAYILDSDQYLATTTSQAGVDYIMGVQSFASPIVITDQTTAFDAAIRVSQGMTVSGVPDDGSDVEFDSGPFVVELTVN